MMTAIIIANIATTGTAAKTREDTGKRTTERIPRIMPLISVVVIMEANPRERPYLNIKYKPRTAMETPRASPTELNLTVDTSLEAIDFKEILVFVASYSNAETASAK